MGKRGKVEGEGSASSIYITDNEEEDRMEVAESRERAEGRKRARNDGREKSSSSTERSGEPAKLRKSEDYIEKIERAMEILKRKARDDKEERIKAQEEREARAVAEQQKIREESEKKENIRSEPAEKIGKIKRFTREIMEAIEKESGGKNIMRGEEQTVVRKAVFEIQQEVLDLIKLVMVAEERARKTEEELKRNKKSMKGVSERKRMSGENERRSERSTMREVSQRRGVVSEESSAEEWKEMKGRKRRMRTYAEVANGSESERIEGRVVVPGREGWKTPPQKWAAGERPLVVTSLEEKDARRLADSLARSVAAKDIGGAPKAVRKVRDGKLVIVPRDEKQKERMAEALKKVKGVEVRESRRAEPLLLVTGVVRGLSDQDLSDQLRRIMDDSKSGVEIKVLKRQECRNNWKENVVVKTSIERKER